MAEAGLCSRRRAEILIKAGVVEVNGRVVRQMGFLVDPSKDKIKVEGKDLAAKRRPFWYALNKPKGVVTTLSDPQGRPCVGDWIKEVGVRLYPVGRLDYVAEGLLLLTNDGAMAHRVMHPSFGIIKRYRVGLQSRPTEAQVKRILAGAVMEGRRVKPRRVRIAPGQNNGKTIEVEVSDGRHHEVRILCERAGLKIQKLVRTAIGGLLLGSLKPGEMKPIQPGDIKKIFSAERNRQPPRRQDAKKGNHNKFGPKAKKHKSIGVRW